MDINWTRTGVLLALLALCGCSTSHAIQVATDKQVISTPMNADKVFPQLSQEIKYVNLFATEMAKYVDKPDSECTMFAPDNGAVQNTMKGLGSYVGLFLQNQTMQEQVFNHHVVPGHIVRAAEFGGEDGKPVPYITRSNQTVWLLQRNGQPYVAFGEKYVVPITIANIKNKANKCVLHIISEQVLIPPSLLPTFEDWQAKAGKPEALVSPKSTWVPSLPTAASPATTTEAAQGPAAAAAVAEPAAAAAPASKPTSGAGSVAASTCIAAATAAAAALLLAL